MKRLKKIIRWMVGVTLTLVLLLYLLLAMPFVQRWMAGVAADVLSQKLGTRVEIGRIELSVLGRAIVDDFRVYDQQDRPMLDVARTAVQLDLFRLVGDGDVIINSAQLFGADIMLLHEHPDSALNAQFLLDSLRSRDQRPQPLPHIELRSLVVRHADLFFDQLWKAHQEERFDPSHVAIKDLSLTAELSLLTSDTLSLALRKLSFAGPHGLSVKHGEGKLTQGRSTGWMLSNLSLSLPHSYLETEALSLSYGQLCGSIAMHVTPSDLSSFEPRLREVTDKFSLSFHLLATEDEARLSSLKLDDAEGALSLSGEVHATQLRDTLPHYELQLDELILTDELQHLVSTLPFMQHPAAVDSPLERLCPLLAKTGTNRISGHASIRGRHVEGNLALSGTLGEAQARADLTDGRLQAEVALHQFRTDLLMNSLMDSTTMVGPLTAKLDADLQLKGSNALPEGRLQTQVTEATYRGYTYRQIKAEAERHGSLLSVSLRSDDPEVDVDAQFHANISDKQPSLRGIADIRHLDLLSTHLMPHARFDFIDARVGIDLAGASLNKLEGTVSVLHIRLHEGEKGDFTLEQMQLTSQPDSTGQHISFRSPYLTAHADGEFQPQQLLNYFRQALHDKMPGMFDAPAQRPECADARLQLQLLDAAPVSRLTGSELALPDGPLTLTASMSRADESLRAHLHAHSLRYAGEELLDLNFRFNNVPDSMQSDLQFQRMMKQNPVSVHLNVSTQHDFINARLSWNDHLTVRNYGELALRGQIQRRGGNDMTLAADITPSELYISDTLWTIKPAQVFYANRKLQVHNFQLAMAGDDRSLSIHGTASPSDEELLFIDLRQMDLSYIFDLARVKPLTLGGLATGTIVARHVLQKPEASGKVNVPHFTFNNAPMGECNCYLSWGVEPGNLDIKAELRDSAAHSHIDVDGTLHLLKDPVQHMDMIIQFERANTAFLNRYVRNIMHDFEGRASGWVRVFGEFRNIDLAGDVLAHHVALTIPSLGVRYHAVEDSIFMRPGYVELRHVTAYDRDGNPGKRGHQAKVDGRISYEHFRDMHYNFSIHGDEILAYDQKDFGDQSFHATVWGSGDVTIDGGPGYTHIDIHATPTPGTTLTYNASNPRTLTQAGFVSYVDRSLQLPEEQTDSLVSPPSQSDMRINFNLNLTPDTQLRLLMDPRTDDYITLHGRAHLLATYYNKGSFQMYGTYHVDRGNYRMTLQDVIRKEFQFSPGGTITFGGAPLDADLNLQAVYTVPSVSLNDLSTRGTFSSSNVRVNCLMNLGGKAGEPHVTFDFDIPNVNDDERRMVRSLISTEEERNMQVIYLLGIGRFYTYDYSATQTQSSTAVNSLLSTTLSGQINQMMNSIIGSQNWSFGANLSTGTMGWSDMDIEGMLSGRLLNNRLLINGNFGYRDNPVAASNFIGDFDLQWLLTRSGNIILKAYSETNDRYFTKSSLTTQGIGILLKRDFSGWSDLFGLRSRHSKPKEPKNTENSAP